MSKPSDPHAKARARKGAIIFTKPSRTVRSQAYETDINNMVKGLTPFTQSRKKPFYVDETALPSSYEEHFNAVLDAQAAFMQLPPDVRERFKNNPALLAQALANPAAHDELRNLGVLPPLSQSPGKPATAAPDGAADKASEKEGTK